MTIANISYVNVGNAPNDGQGDPLRTSFQLINSDVATISNLMPVNGTSNISVPIANANVDIWAGGNLVATFTPSDLTGNTGIYFTGNLNIAKDLNVLGNVNYSNTTQSTTTDALIELAANNTSDLRDIGFMGQYVQGNGDQFTGLVRQASTQIWKLCSNVTTNPASNTNIDFTPAIYNTLQVGNIEAGFGNIVTTGNVNAGNVNVGQIIATGNITTIGNVAGQFILGNGSQLTGMYSTSNLSTDLQNLTSNVITTANIQADYFIGNGRVLSGINSISNGNSNVSIPDVDGNVYINNSGRPVPWTFAVDGVINLPPTGIKNLQPQLAQLSDQYWVAPANGVAGLVSNDNDQNIYVSDQGVALQTNATVDPHEWSFDKQGNLSLPAGGNINYANGDLYTTYTDSNVSVYLASGTANANITTTANVQANYFIGDGSSLTNINGANIIGGYGDANVSAYLASGTANADIITTANIAGDYILGNGSQLTDITKIGNATNNVTVTDTGNITANLVNKPALNISSTQVGVGVSAGEYTQGSGAVAVGYQAGFDAQGALSVAVGYQAGRAAQSTGAVAVGADAGKQQQGVYGIAIGSSAGRDYQADGAIAIGVAAGYTNQLSGAIAIGSGAGGNTQGRNSIAIGTVAGGNSFIDQQANNSIIINATGQYLVGNTSGLFVAPIRNDNSNTANALYYDAVSKEVSYGAAYSNTTVANYLPTYTGNLTSLTGNVTTTANISGSYILGNGSQLTGIPSPTVITALHSYYVAKNGNDTTGTGSVVNPYLTISKAISVAGNRSQIIVNPGDYTENITIANVTSISLSSTGSGTTDIYGNFVISGSSTGLDFRGLGIHGNLILSATGSSYFREVNVGTTGIPTVVTKSGSGYVEFVGSDLQSGAGVTRVDVTGAGQLTFSDTKLWNLTVANSNAIVSTFSSPSVSNISLISGTLSLFQSVVFSFVNGGNAIVSNGGTLYLKNTGIVNPNLSSAKISLSANTVLACDDANFDRANSSIGFSANVIADFQSIRTNFVNTGNLVATGNITTTANISGGYILGNGSQLTGLPVTYGDANVANYLPTYSGNLDSLTGNVITTANVSGNYFIGNGSQLTGINTIVNTTSFVTVASPAGAITANVAGNTALNLTANSVALGTNATATGSNSISIGKSAVSSGANVITLNATGAALTTTQSDSFFVDPIRNDTANISTPMYYNAATKEVTYGPLQSLPTTDFLQGARSGDQGPIGAGTNIIFNSVRASSGIVGGMTLNTTTGVITLPPNKTYKLSGHVMPYNYTINAFVSFNWYNVTTGSIIDPLAYSYLQPMPSPFNGASQPVSSVIFTPTVTTQVAFRLAGGTTNVDIRSAYSFFDIVEIGTTGITGSFALNGTISATGNVSTGGNLVATGNVSGTNLVATNASGNEGGEINLAKPPTSTLAGGVTVDAYVNQLRFFEQGGNTRGAYIDLTQAPANAAYPLINRAYNIAGANTKVTLNNITAQVGGSPTRLYIGTATSNLTVAGDSQTMSANTMSVSSWVNTPIVTGAGNEFAMSGTLTNNGDTAVLNIIDQGTGTGMWRITGMIANTTANLYGVTIEKLA